MKSQRMDGKRQHFGIYGHTQALRTRGSSTQYFFSKTEAMQAPG